LGLSDAKVEPAVPVSDIAKAKEFYEGKLGLSGGRNIGDGGITYPVGSGREIHIYPSPNAGKSGGTIAAWEVNDLDKTVDELTANGVSFMQVDNERIKTNEKGIAALGEDRMAWFSDPDGNVYGIAQL
jgi:catechol 2,3-dioxygenase-like lactoylglutathione lyase family enzyme